MTDIDRTADIEVSRGFAQVTVRIPLTGHVSQEWVSRFGSLAHKWLVHSGNESALHWHGGSVIEAEDLPDDRSWVNHLPQPDTDSGPSCTSRSILEPEAPPEAISKRYRQLGCRLLVASVQSMAAVRG
jgi:hypothetical protein